MPAGTTPGFGDAVRTVDPLGFTIELVHHIDHVEPLVQRYDLRHGASINRLDHINIATPDVPVAFDYYTKLGFGLSETIEDFDDGTLFAAWMFRKQTVHDVAFTLGSGPMIHHIAFAVPESHNIFSLCDTIGALDLQASVIERVPAGTGVGRVLPLHPRPRRAPRRDLHDRLFHR